MGKEEKILAQMQSAPQNVRYTELVSICQRYFGPARQTGTSHAVFKTPWQGDPRVNIQNKNGYAKPYQVKQVLHAINKLKGQTND